MTVMGVMGVTVMGTTVMGMTVMGMCRDDDGGAVGDTLYRLITDHPYSLHSRMLLTGIQFVHAAKRYPNWS
jgi:hypothetical protein